MTPEQACTVATQIVEEIAQQAQRPAVPASLAVCVLRELVHEVRRSGVSLAGVHGGPWVVARSAPNREGEPRGLVAVGQFSMIIESHEQPYEIAALLNWCGCDEPNQPARSPRVPS